MVAKRRNVKSGAQAPKPVELAHDIADRTTDFITEQELEKMLKAASNRRHKERDKAIMMVMYWHGMRVTELVNIKLSHLDLTAARLTAKRIKNSRSTEHPIRGDVMRSIKRWTNLRGLGGLPWLFVNERGTQMTRQAIWYIIKTTAEKARIEGVHPHSFRHGCGYNMANRGTDLRVMQDYLGHKDPKHTVLYTRIAPRQFENLWD